MMQLKLIKSVLLSVVVAVPAVAAPARQSITAEQIAAAMNGAGMQITAQQVSLLTDVVATTSRPVLKVRSLEPWGDHRMMVRLECANPEECLPFFVAARFSQGNDVHPVTSDSERASATTSDTQTKAASTPPVMRTGALATLMIDSNSMHIKLAVVSLENGTTGQTIRVASKDRKQIYSAKVVSSTLLVGSL
jgi:hypothetical protein